MMVAGTRSMRLFLFQLLLLSLICLCIFNSLIVSGSADNENDILFQKQIELPNNIKDVRSKLAVGRVFVPVIGRRYLNFTSFGEIRNHLFLQVSS